MKCLQNKRENPVKQFFWLKIKEQREIPEKLLVAKNSFCSVIKMFLNTQKTNKTKAHSDIFDYKS